MSTIDPSAAERMAASGKTFDRAARLLPRHSRALVVQLYSFCRQVDDVADESHLPVAVRHGHLLAIEASLLGTAAPEIAFRCGWSGELDHALRRSRSSAVQLVRTVRQDLAQQQPKDETALEEYAFGVAGTVGLMLCDVLGARWEGRDAAVHLGIAMQISNIARDVASDWQSGRVYLPESYISTAAVGDALLRKDRAAERSLTLATTRLLALAERHYEHAYDGIWTLPVRVRWSILAAARCYRQIGIEVGKDIPRSWDRRTTVSSARKLWLIAQASLWLLHPRFWKARVPQADPFEQVQDVPGNARQADAQQASV